MDESEEEIDISLLARYDFGYMRRFAFGCLKMDPDKFGEMLVGDFFDAMGGYTEQRAEDIKVFVSVIRTSAFLATVRKEDRISMHEFWSLPWDKDEEVRSAVTKEEYEEQIRAAEDFFKKTNKL